MIQFFKPIFRTRDILKDYGLTEMIFRILHRFHVQNLLTSVASGGIDQ